MDFKSFFLKCLIDDDMRQRVHSNKSVDKMLEDFVEEFTELPPSFEPTVKTVALDTKSHVGYAVEDHLANGRYTNAAHACTKELQINAPYTKNTAALYAHRVVALKNLKLYEEALLDCERASVLPSTPYVAAMITRDKEEVEEKLRANLANKSPKTNQKSEQMSGHRPRVEEPKFAHGESEELPGTSNAIRVVHDPKYGRHLVATKAVNIGETLIVDKPCVLYPVYIECEERGFACDYCTKFSKAPVPCDRCPVLYCSEACRDAAFEKFHDVECQFSECHDDVKYLLRLLVILTDHGAKLEEAKKIAKELDALSEDSLDTLCAADQVSTDRTKAVINLSYKMTKHGNTSHVAEVAAALTMLLRNYTNFFRGSNDVMDHAKLMLRLSNILHKNETLLTYSDIKVRYGLSAIFSMAHLLVHSCCSNVICYINEDNSLTVRAVRNIEPGDKITFNFLGKMLLDLESVDRRKLLFKIGRFCECEACHRNYRFRPEIRSKLHVPQRLQRRIRKNPNDLDCAWDVLKLINTEIDRPCFETEIMKYAIMENFAGKGSSMLWGLYSALGIV